MRTKFIIWFLRKFDVYRRMSSLLYEKNARIAELTHQTLDKDILIAAQSAKIRELSLQVKELSKGKKVAA